MFLKEENLWWHIKQGEQIYYYYGNRPPTSLDKAIRLVAGKLAPILENYGYLIAKPNSYDLWREWDSSGNTHPINARPIYPFSLDWSEEMKALIKQYGELVISAQKSTRNIEQIKNEKGQNQAQDLWNKI